MDNLPVGRYLTQDSYDTATDGPESSGSTVGPESSGSKRGTPAVAREGGMEVGGMEVVGWYPDPNGPKSDDRQTGHSSLSSGLSDHSSESSGTQREWDWILYCKECSVEVMSKKECGQMILRVTKTSSDLPNGSKYISTTSVITDPKQFIEAGLPLGGIVVDKTIERRFPVDVGRMAQSRAAGNNRITWKHALGHEGRSCYRFSFYGNTIFRAKLDVLDVTNSASTRPCLVAAASAEIDHDHPIVCAEVEVAHHHLLDGYGPGLMDGEMEEIHEDDSVLAKNLLVGHDALSLAL